VPDPPNTFTGIHAELYDLVYEDKPYAAEADWVLERLAEVGVRPARLLDVACGTGRHAAAFAARGIEVTGVDLNEALLEHARRRAPAARFVAGDMTELDLGERFDAVTCLFDSIGYPVSDEGVVAALASIGAHLDGGGAGAIEFLHAPAMRSGASPVRVRRIATPGGGTLVRIAETELGERTMEVAYELIDLRADGSWDATRERQANRFFELAEMAELIRRAGLEPLAFRDAYCDGAPDDESFHVVALIGRAA